MHLQLAFQVDTASFCHCYLRGVRRGPLLVESFHVSYFMWRGTGTRVSNFSAQEDEAGEVPPNEAPCALSTARDSTFGCWAFWPMFWIHTCVNSLSSQRMGICVHVSFWNQIQEIQMFFPSNFFPLVVVREELPHSYRSEF